MPPTQLLWVNKSAASVSLSDSYAEERNKINSHIQTWRRQRKVQSDVCPSSPRPQKTLLPLGLRQHTTRRSKHSSKDDVISDVVSTEQQVTRRYQSDPWITLHENLHHPQQWSICLPGHAADPFGFVCLDNQTHSLLQYYITVSFPSTWHTETKSGRAVEHVHRSAEMKMIRGCLEREIDMATMTAAVASRVENYEKVKVEGGTDKFMFRALKALRMHLAKNSLADEELVMDMLHLCCAEAYRFNTVEALVHLRACKRLVDTLGGLRAIDTHLAESLSIADLVVASEQLMVPVFEIAFDPGFGTCKEFALPKSLADKTMGGRLLEFCQQHGAWQSYMLIQEIIECAVVLRHTSSLNNIPDLLRWLHLRSLAVRHQLLAALPQDPLIRILHTALTTWMLQIFTRLGPRRMVKIIAPKLAELLRSTVWPRPSLDVYAWVLTIGATAAQGMPHQGRFVEKLVSLPQPFNLSTAADLFALQEQCLYLDHVQRPWMESLAATLCLPGEYLNTE